MTNGDKIRQMSDRELAQLYAAKCLEQAFMLMPVDVCKTYSKAYMGGMAARLSANVEWWMKSEATDES